jgi:hypothetical protein
MTLAEALGANQRWIEQIAESAEPYATEEWKAEATGLASRKGEAIKQMVEEYGPDYELPTFANFDTSPLFTGAQRWVIRWQFKRHLRPGPFTEALMEAAANADTVNQARLALGFPDLIEGIRRYRGEEGYSDFMELLDRR